MKTKILSIFTRTPLHVGAGSSVGAIDMPVVRERHTRFPVIPGSSIKGVLADLWNDADNVDDEYTRNEESDARKIFGDNNPKEKNACAGNMLFGEGKLLAFPVRSAKGCFAFITCPLAMQRFIRDTGNNFQIPSLADGKVIISSKELSLENKIILEEFPMDIDSATIPQEWLTTFKSLNNDTTWKDNVDEHLVVVSDEQFAYFVENACEVANHNCIDDATGVAKDKALFCQENVPSEAMFYCVLNVVKDNDEELFGKIETKLQKNNNLVQIGANATTGLGWCSVLM